MPRMHMIFGCRVFVDVLIYNPPVILTAGQEILREREEQFRCIP